MKKYSFIKKFSFFSFLFLLCVGLVGCGKTPTKFDGKWNAIYCQSMSVDIPVEKAFAGGMSFEIDGSEKVVMKVGEKSGNVTWEEKDGKFILDIDGEKATGIPGKDFIKFEKILGQPLTVIFAKEGSQADNYVNYMPEEEKNLLGKWVSESVTDIIGNPTNKISNPKGALELEISVDKTGKKIANIKYNGKEYKNIDWIYGIKMVNIDIDKDKLSIMASPDKDKLKISLNDNGEYFNFTSSLSK